MKTNLAVNVATKDQKAFANLAALVREVSPVDMPPLRHGRLALMKVICKDLGVPVEDAANDPMRYMHQYVNKHRGCDAVVPSELIDRTRRPALSLAKAWGPNYHKVAGAPLVRSIGASARYITNK